MALACDMPRRAEDAIWACRSAARFDPRRGGTQRLPRAVGVSEGVGNCLQPRHVSGADAERLGWSTKQFPRRSKQNGGRVSESNLKGAPMSVAFIKEAIQEGVELSLEGGLRLEADLSDGRDYGR